MRGHRTRLGEARVTVLLLKWEHSTLNFFSSEPKFSEELSQVSISETKISKEYPIPESWQVHLGSLNIHWPTKDDGGFLYPLKEKIVNGRGKLLTRTIVRY